MTGSISGKRNRLLSSEAKRSVLFRTLIRFISPKHLLFLLLRLFTTELLRKSFAVVSVDAVSVRQVISTVLSVKSRPIQSTATVRISVIQRVTMRFRSVHSVQVTIQTLKSFWVSFLTGQRRIRLILLCLHFVPIISPRSFPSVLLPSDEAVLPSRLKQVHSVCVTL